MEVGYYLFDGGGGDEFIALAEKTDAAALNALAETMQKKIAEYNQERSHFGEFADRSDFVLILSCF